MSSEKDNRTYLRADCAVFRRTGETFGGLSNMAPGYPVRVNGVRLLTVEALYQACRFPHRVDVQRLIIGQHSPMTAKMVSKPYAPDSRPDWDRVRVKIMRWCLRLKLATHYPKFSLLLLSTGERAIVEDSRKDTFWGAVPSDAKALFGRNVLGRLLMELREEIKAGAELRVVVSPAIPNFLLFGEQLAVVDFRSDKNAPIVATATPTKQAFDDLPLPLFAEAFASQSVHAMSLERPQQSAERSQGLIEVLKPYAEYKESGLHWLGGIPEHWEIRRTKYLLRETNARSSTGREQLLRVSQYTGVTRRVSLDGSDGVDSRAASLVGYKCVSVNDLVINIMLAWNGSMGVSHYDGIASPAYCVYRLKGKASPWYFHHLLRLPLYKGRIKTASTGVVESRLRLYSDDLGRIEALLPSLDEQTAIVRFLDHANRKVDGFIHAKRKLITLLNEQKQAIIYNTVTRGLDTGVPLRPSGASWLGDIPAHWEVRRVKQAAKILRGKFTHRPRNDPSLYDGPYPFIQTGSVARAKKFITDYKQTLNERGLSVSKLFPKGTLCMTIAANIGDVAILDFEACFPDSVVGFVPQAGLDRNFLYLIFRCMKPELLRDAPVNTQGNLNVERIGTKLLPFPRIEEQRSIVHYVDTETGSFDEAIARTEREIALMQEYRVRLTADIVTGKLDVRAAAAKLPETPPDTEVESVIDDEAEEAEAEEVS